MEFLAWWNHDIDVRILGLPTKYANYYDGWEIEEEIEITSDWDDLLEVAHPHIRATKHFASTGEMFGLNKAATDIDGNANNTIDPELEHEIGTLVDVINDGSLDEETVENDVASKQVLTGSAAWVATNLGRSRAFGRVLTKTENSFFRSNYHRFQTSQDLDNETDSFLCIAFSAFALFWNEFVEDEEKGQRPRTDMTLKTAFHLQAFWKQLKKDSNAAATLLSVHNQNKTMRQELCGPNRTVDKEVAAAVSAPIVSNVQHAERSQTGLNTQQFKVPAQVAPFAGPTVKDANISTRESHGGTPLTLKQSKRKRTGRRCRKCGHQYARENAYGPFHTGIGVNGASSFQLPEVVCQVPAGERCSGFPLKEGQSMPRRSRAKPKLP